MANDPTGPRGGKTTMTGSGLVRKTVWLHVDEADELRRRAYEDRRSESEIVREALRKLLSIED
jgi:hypothetical protein